MDATIYFVLVLAVCLQSGIYANDDIPEQCNSQTYCTVKSKKYPEEKFNNMYKDLVLLVEPPPADEFSLNNRDSTPNEEDNCEVIETVDPVYYVREDLDKPWRTVIQAPHVDYVQKVRIEKCAQAGGPCFTLFQTPDVMGYYETFCQQTYLYYNFLVEKSKDSTETETVRAKLPACCSCHYRSKKGTK